MRVGRAHRDRERDVFGIQLGHIVVTTCMSVTLSIFNGVIYAHWLSGKINAFRINYSTLASICGSSENYLIPGMLPKPRMLSPSRPAPALPNPDFSTIVGMELMNI